MIGLFIILILVLFLPFSIKRVEENLEVFLFVMGLAAAFISGVFDKELLGKALTDPIKITIAVFVASLLFKWFKEPLERTILFTSRIVPFPLFIASTIIVLGLLSSVITAIIAALVLVLIISVLKLDKKSTISYAVIGCFAIGLGAVLTPIGEPLSTIAISKLNGDFNYLLNLLGIYIIPGVIILGIFAGFMVKLRGRHDVEDKYVEESYDDIVIRTIKIYIFVMGLTLLGAGFEPLINAYLLDLNSGILYWINMLSAVLDNATLAAAEISPVMSTETVKAILIGLLISGGMLIPGNIPNIISAGKLGISSTEWARFGLPLGLVMMVVYFIVLVIG